MAIFSALSFILIFTYLITRNVDKKQGKKVYCILAFVFLTLLMGLRNRYVGGVDTNLFFIPQFEGICNSSMEQVINRYSNKDLMFYILTKLFSYVSDNSQVYLLTIAAIATGTYCRFVYKYSVNPLFSFIIYLALGYYGIGFQMLRHIAAVSVILYSYEYLKERKLIPFIITVIIASSLHISALIFIIAYPLYSWKIGYKQLGMLLAAILVVLFFKDMLMDIFEMVLSGEDRFKNYFSIGYNSQLSLSGFMILLVVYITSLYLLPKESKDTLEIRGLLNLSLISAIMMFMVIIIGEFHRISMYFGMFNTLLLPLACKLYNGRKKILVYLVIGSVLLLYFIFFQLENQNMLEYKFYWQ